ncbi:lysoplasmalogenase [Streptomyces cavernicola]|uniref:Lysoplasmalogenase n=1 Tax=Streptomyces cavernicola TaxID=3043613 RepID=A0ABT6S9U3_9ACTN|nr:lysoplasmalogenase [Streptomyces sp. B-S-A6]MDI3404928.1 lysoplasmalogenase [Streptomyces sp. B-S-A6]
MSRERLLLAAFGLALAGDLTSLLAEFTPGHTVFKPLLMPLLAAYAVCAWRSGEGTAGVPRLLVAALLFGWGGDTLLLFDAELAFLGGMASFAAGHVCYLLLFARYGKGRPYTLALGLGYGAALAGTVALLWSDLPADLRVPVAGYSLLLTAMAFRSARLGLAAGVGGALFLLSDTLIATGIAEWPQLPRPDFWVMLTYAAAQYLLTSGVLAARPEATPEATPDANPEATPEARTTA